MLRDGGQALVEQVLQGVVICAHIEELSPEIWPPVMNNLHEANELLFICRQFGVVWRQGSVEERNGTGALVKDRAYA
jgi:hypothetical protein